MDWVNQVKYIEQANTLVSCSNDSTIKVWRLKQLEDYLAGEVKRSKDQRPIVREQGPFSSLNDHSDYVRTIDYAKQRGSLFSASDDGQLFMWDLNAEKLVQKYSFADQAAAQPMLQDREESKEEQKQVAIVSEEYPVVAHHMDILERSSCPTAMSCSQPGNMVFVAYTDNSLYMFDVRAPGSQH